MATLSDSSEPRRLNAMTAVNERLSPVKIGLCTAINRSVCSLFPMSNGAKVCATCVTASSSTRFLLSQLKKKTIAKRKGTEKRLQFKQRRAY